MAITFVGEGTTISNSNLIGTTGISPVPHASTTTDDLMLVFQHRNQDDGSFDSAPSGWTEITNQSTSGGQDMQTQILYRIATSGSEATPTFTHSDTTGEQWSATILTFRGVDTTTPIDVTFVAGSHFTALQNKASPNVDAFDSITTVTNGAWVIALEAVTHDDITSNADPTNYTNAMRLIGGSEDFRQMQVWYREITTAGSETPGAPGYTSNATVAESHQYTIALRPKTDGITSIDPTEFDMDTADVDINGTNFEASQGTGSVYLSDANTLAGSANEVDITSAVNTWSDTVVNLDLTQLSASELTDLHTLGPGQRYVILVNDSSDEYGSSAITLHRPHAFEMVAGSLTEGNTTERLAMSGTFGGGKATESANPHVTAVDLAADEDREDLWLIQAKTNAREVQYDFRLIYSGSSAVAETITQTPQVTIEAAGTTIDLTTASLGTTAQSIQNTLDLAFSLASLGFTSQDIQLLLALELTTASLNNTAQDLSINAESQLELTAASLGISPQTIQNLLAIAATNASMGITPQDVQITTDLPMSLASLSMTAQDIAIAQALELTTAALALTGQSILHTLGIELTTPDVTFDAQDIEVDYSVGGTTIDLTTASFATTALAIQEALEVGLTTASLSVTPQDMQVTVDMALGLATLAIDSSDIQVTNDLTLTSASLGFSSTDFQIAQDVNLDVGTLSISPQALGFVNNLELTTATFTFASEDVQITTTINLTTGAFSMTAQDIDVTAAVAPAILNELMRVGMGK